MENKNSFSQELHQVSSKCQEGQKSLPGQKCFRRLPQSTVMLRAEMALSISISYCSPCKNEETEAQKEKGLGP